MEKDKAQFKVFSKEQYDQMFEGLRKIPSHWNPKKINQSVLDNMSMVLILAQPFSDEITDNVHYYRIRVFNEGDTPVDESKASSFSYAPKKYCELGRANRKGKQV